MGSAVSLIMGDRTSKRHEKVPVSQGYSQMHWMTLTQRAKDLSGRNGAALRSDITIEEVGKHHTQYDAWTVLDNRVYNITPYLKYHPGGVEQIMLGAGIDSTALFNEHHAWVNGHSMLEKCLIGKLAEDSAQSSSSLWLPFTVTEIRKSNESSIVNFTLTTSEEFKWKSGCTGQHVLVRCKVNGQWIERPYTPIKGSSTELHLAIKCYSDGKMSQELLALGIGDKLDIYKSPRDGLVQFKGDDGLFNCGNIVEKNITTLSLLAGGTGVTPMLQLLPAVLKSDFITSVTLIYAVKSPKDLIAESLLESFNVEKKFSYKVLYSSRMTNEEYLEQQLKPPSKEHLVLYCGPLAFDREVSQRLKDLNYNQIYNF